MPLTPICETSSKIKLENGFPQGGIYSGDFVIGGYFYPQLSGSGTHQISYEYTNAEGCTGTASMNIAVLPVQEATLEPISTICAEASPITLIGGLPTNGVFSGTGVQGGQFDPSVAGPVSYTHLTLPTKA